MKQFTIIFIIFESLQIINLCLFLKYLNIINKKLNKIKSSTMERNENLKWKI